MIISFTSCSVALVVVYVTLAASLLCFKMCLKDILLSVFVLYWLEMTSCVVSSNDVIISMWNEHQGMNKVCLLGARMYLFLGRI